MSKIVEVTDAFWRGRQIAGVPAEYVNKIDTEQGFRIQIAMQKRFDMAGDVRIGWKVAATNPAVQQQLGVKEPAFGSLRRTRSYQSGHDLAITSLVQPHAECEICFELNDRVLTAVTLDDAYAAVAKCYPAFEIIEKRVPISDFGGAMADNAEHTAIVLGKGVDVPAGFDFSTVECRLELDGKLIGSAPGSAVLGNPLNSILWLKQRLKRYEVVLEPGSLVMTGSFLRQQPITDGSSFTARFSGIGSVEMQGVM